MDKEIRLPNISAAVFLLLFNDLKVLNDLKDFKVVGDYLFCRMVNVTPPVSQKPGRRNPPKSQ